MKLGEGGEAFFVFETSDDIPEALQTSPLVSPAIDPKDLSTQVADSALQEPEYLDLSVEEEHPSSRANRRSMTEVAMLSPERRAHSDLGLFPTGLPICEH